VKTLVGFRGGDTVDIVAGFPTAALSAGFGFGVETSGGTPSAKGFRAATAARRLAARRAAVPGEHACICVKPDPARRSSSESQSEPHWTTTSSNVFFFSRAASRTRSTSISVASVAEFDRREGDDGIGDEAFGACACSLPLSLAFSSRELGPVSGADEDSARARAEPSAAQLDFQPRFRPTGAGAGAATVGGDAECFDIARAVFVTRFSLSESPRP
jgi:hypothetical protein